MQVRAEDVECPSHYALNPNLYLNLNPTVQVRAEDVECSSHYVFDSKGHVLACFGHALDPAGHGAQGDQGKHAQTQQNTELAGGDEETACNTPGGGARGRHRRNWHIPRERLRAILYNSLLPGSSKPKLLAQTHRVMDLARC